MNKTVFLLILSPLNEITAKIALINLHRESQNNVFPKTSGREWCSADNELPCRQST